MRTAASAACLVLGTGLVAGALAAHALAGDPPEPSPYERGRSLWHSVPVDRLFPPALHGDAAGPGGADRDWRRLGVAPDTGCAGAFDPALARALAPAGCTRLLRATYTDATATTVTTVGLLVTGTGPAGMRALRDRFDDGHLDRRTDLMPHPYAPPGTLAARFGDAQRASWRVTVLTDAPAVVYTVTGFADARTDTPPQPASDALLPGAASAVAQAGLAHDATALADRLERTLREALRATPEQTP
ncbi:hypothetical protein AB0K09_21845 [Streptomyces sp. NPDC049577]|uniref:hypothetical protein n=1 Tax=Streptomyces sp. NPDC049577 TaxID=3155153 RepID=UPI00342883D3